MKPTSSFDQFEALYKSYFGELKADDPLVYAQWKKLIDQIPFTMSLEKIFDIVNSRRTGYGKPLIPDFKSVLRNACVKTDGYCTVCIKTGWLHYEDGEGIRWAMPCKCNTHEYLNGVSGGEKIRWNEKLRSELYELADSELK